MKKIAISLSLLFVFAFSQLYAETIDVVLRIGIRGSDEKVITKENLVKIK